MSASEVKDVGTSGSASQMTLIESVRELNQKLDGPEVLSYIREDPSLKRLCVTILSSSPADVMVNRALGADYYFSKPSDVAS